jgi:import receptor subunit TOM70
VNAACRRTRSYLHTSPLSALVRDLVVTCSSEVDAVTTGSLPTLPDPPSTGDNALVLALEALSASSYAHAVTLANEAVEQGCSTDTLKSEALNVRGTFRFLMGDTEGGAADLEEAVKLNVANTQAWVKLASVHMEQGDHVQAFACFDKAVEQNADDPDIYYHRGQVLFIMNEFVQAAENYQMSSKLDDTFVFSHIQLAVAQYKMGNLANSMATFRRTMKAFPDRSEPQNY